MSKLDGKDGRLQTIIGTMQLVVLILGVAAIFMGIGQRDQTVTTTVENLDELQGIVHDLVKAQVAGATKDSEHDRVLGELRNRIYQLEQRR
tara:strand:+ start:527 stop:799 length:273 start_codon:yes stop_codon:yes gene_type:complete